MNGGDELAAAVQPFLPPQGAGNDEIQQDILWNELDQPLLDEDERKKPERRVHGQVYKKGRSFFRLNYHI